MLLSPTCQRLKRRINGKFFRGALNEIFNLENSKDISLQYISLQKDISLTLSEIVDNSKFIKTTK